MREIKFRAWDGRKMIDTGVLHDTTRGSYEMWDGNTHEYYPVMQFTGLKDKNGKEIYEGDVLRAFEPETETTTGELRMTVDDAFNCYAPIRDLIIDKKQPEIIGDIYSNPELLNK